MKDLAFGMATFGDPAAGFDNVLICTYLRLRQSLATTQSCNSFFPFSPVGLRGAGLKVWGFRHFRLLLAPDTLSLWPRLLQQCYPVKGTTAALVLGTDLPACSPNSPCHHLYSFPQGTCWLLPPWRFGQVLMLNVCPSSSLSQGWWWHWWRWVCLPADLLAGVQVRTWSAPAPLALRWPCWHESAGSVPPWRQMCRQWSCWRWSFWHFSINVVTPLIGQCWLSRASLLQT